MQRMSLSSKDAGEDARRGSTSDPETRNSGSSATLGPVAQQAQQFLEQNIRYLLRPRPSLVQAWKFDGGAIECPVADLEREELVAQSIKEPSLGEPGR
ncbi:hypothetical protein HPB47_002257 [Ixodes persulcatus]|uniref:Uncharacterized protein n=1 Tax=Ixodes persulcatus TaxID=34615 RepID=A0AC60PLP9_IXOPE|nr:hypothetical protein HPB47_002257 [Ixodes persulcatus]